MVGIVEDSAGRLANHRLSTIQVVDLLSSNHDSERFRLEKHPQMTQDLPTTSVSDYLSLGSVLSKLETLESRESSIAVDYSEY